MRLTRANINRLQLPEGKSDLIVFDDALPGFGIRVRAGGKRVWIAQYRLGTKQRRITLGNVEAVDPDQARQLAKSTLAKVHLGPGPIKPFERTGLL
jgi:Arm DNA-binding domain